MKFGIREALLAALLLGLPLGAWWFVFRPANDQHSEVRKQVEAKQQKLRKLNRLVGTVGSLKEEIASLEKAIAFFQSKLPSEKEIDKVLWETWRLAERNKLATKSIRTETRGPRSTSPYDTGSQSEQPIVIKLEGDFNGLYTFLQELENQPRIMRISRMKIVKAKKAPEGHVEASLDVSVFFEHSE